MDNQAVKQYEKNLEDIKVLNKTVEEFIDMHFTQFAENIDFLNVGNLRGVRTVLEQNLENADKRANELLLSNKGNASSDYKISLGSLFAVIAKISDRIGYIDYLIDKRKIK